MDPDPRSLVNTNRPVMVTVSLSLPGSTGVELGVRKGAIDIAVELGELAFDVVCGQQHFQRSAPAAIVLWGRHRPVVPPPTSLCERIAFSRFANRMSLASANSVPTPVAHWLFPEAVARSLVLAARTRCYVDATAFWSGSGRYAGASPRPLRGHVSGGD
jgi:hypothetical protein